MSGKSVDLVVDEDAESGVDFQEEEFALSLGETFGGVGRSREGLERFPANQVKMEQIESGRQEREIEVGGNPKRRGDIFVGNRCPFIRRIGL